MDIGIILFILALCLVVLTSLGILSLFGLTRWLEQVVFVLIISSANIIFTTFILSFFKSINQYGFLIVHAIFLSLVFFITKSARKNLVPSFAKVNLSEFKGLKKYPPILIIGAGMVVFLAASFFLILFVPANTWDSMTYHLSRIGFWLQNSSLDFFQTYNFRQNSLPPNAEILIMWPIAFIKSDILTGFVQFIGYLGIILLVYGIALELGASRSQSIFASLVWASIPEVMLEATSTQNDLVVTFFLMASVFFTIKGINESGWKGFVVSGISLGLAVGTKGTAIFALPGIFIGALFLFARVKNNLSRNLTIWLVSVSTGIIVFGLYSYIQNYINYGYPFGPKSVTTYTNPNIVNMLSNLYHIGYRFLDTSGFMRIPAFYHPRFHEDLAGYGLIWLLLGIPAFFYAFYKGFLKKDFLIASIFIIAFGYLLCFSFALEKNPWIFRLLIPFTAMVSPLVSSFYPNTDIYRKWVFIAVAAICVIPIFASTFANPSKPIKKSFFEKNFYEKRFMVHFKRDEMLIFRELDRMAKAGSRIGIIASGDDWDYPAFGKRFDRIVIPIIVRDEDPNADVFAKYNLDYLIVFAPVQAFEDFKLNVIPFIEQLVKDVGSSLNIGRAGNIFLFARKV